MNDLSTIRQQLFADLGVWVDAIQLIITVIAGVLCYIWIRPADKKLQQLQADLQRQTDKVDTIRSAVMDAGVEYQIEQHRNRVKEHLLIYRAFRKIMSYSGLLQSGESLKDLAEIKRTHSHSQGLRDFSVSLLQTIPQDWAKDSVFEEAAEAQLFVSERVWRLFVLGKSLLLSFQLQLHELGLDTETTIITNDGIKKTIATLFPNDVSFFEQFGTSYYYSLLKKIEAEIIAALQEVINRSPIDPKPLCGFNELVESIAVAQPIQNPVIIPNFARRNPSELQSLTHQNTSAL